jgi:threonyl-tRNA synthetase
VKVEKVPYFVVVGDSEVDSNTVTVETRAGEKTSSTPLSDFITSLTAEISERR